MKRVCARKREGEGKDCTGIEGIVVQREKMGWRRDGWMWMKSEGTKEQPRKGTLHTHAHTHGSGAKPPTDTNNPEVGEKNERKARAHRAERAERGSEAEWHAGLLRAICPSVVCLSLSRRTAPLLLSYSSSLFLPPHPFLIPKQCLTPPSERESWRPLPPSAPARLPLPRPPLPRSPRQSLPAAASPRPQSSLERATPCLASPARSLSMTRKMTTTLLMTKRTTMSRAIYRKSSRMWTLMILVDLPRRKSLLPPPKSLPPVVRHHPRRSLLLPQSPPSLKRRRKRDPIVKTRTAMPFLSSASLRVLVTRSPLTPATLSQEAEGRVALESTTPSLDPMALMMTKSIEPKEQSEPTLTKRMANDKKNRTQFIKRTEAQMEDESNDFYGQTSSLQPPPIFVPNL